MSPFQNMMPLSVRWSEGIQLAMLLEPAIRGISYQQGVFVTIIGWVMLLVPAYIIISATRFKKEWARVTLLLLAVGGIAMAIFSRDLFAFEEPERVIASATSIPNLIAVGLLFTRTASAWFTDGAIAPIETSVPASATDRSGENMNSWSPKQLRAAATRLEEIAEKESEPERKTKLLRDAKNLDIVARMKEVKLARKYRASEFLATGKSGEEQLTRFTAPEADAFNTPPNQLRQIFEQASGPMKEPIRDQLAYRHMIALADNFEGWALDARMTPEQTAKLVGWAESLRSLAEEVGPAWDPPTPDQLTLMGFLGRKVLDE